MFFMIYKTIPQCENLSLLLSSPPLPHPNAFSKGTRTNCYCYTPTPLHPTPPSSLITIRAKMRNEPNQSKGVTRRLNSAICSLIQPSFCSLVLLLTFRFFPTAPLPYTRARAYTHTLTGTPFHSGLESRYDCVMLDFLATYVNEAKC